MDRISILGIECLCHVGVPHAERKRRQKILVDVDLDLDLSDAGRTDDFRKTVDYLQLEKLVRQTAESRPVCLVESLAHRIGQAVLDFDGKIESTRVRVRKFPKSMPRTREVVVEARKDR